MKTIIACTTVGLATASSNPGLISIVLDTNQTPFNGTIDATLSPPTISSFHPGASGNSSRKMALDLAYGKTSLLAHLCASCSPNDKDVKTTPFAVENTSEGTQSFSYDFDDGSVSDLTLVNWKENACLNDFCIYDYYYWSLETAQDLSVSERGVLGLGHVQANTFPQAMKDSEVLGTSLFSLTFGGASGVSELTLGGINPAYHSPTAETLAAKAFGSPEWEVQMDKFSYGTDSYPYQVNFIISLDSMSFQLPYPVFNRITNSWIKSHPEFERNLNLQPEAACACPTDDTELTFSLVAPGSTSADPQYVDLKIPASRYLLEENNKCTLLFMPYEGHGEQKAKFGIGLLEEFIVGFNGDDDTVSFTQREDQTAQELSVQERLRTL